MKKIKIFSLMLLLMLSMSACSLNFQKQEVNNNDGENLINEEEESTEKEISQENQKDILEEKKEIDTSDWLTYFNKEYGFEIKYPKEMFIKNMDNGIIFNNESNKLFSLEIFINKNSSTAREWMNNRWAEYSGKWPGVYKNENINGINTTKAILDNLNLEYPYNCYNEYVVFPKKDIFLLFYSGEMCYEKNYEKDIYNMIELFKNIISTCNFVNHL